MSHIVVACKDAGGPGSVSNVAVKQAIELSKHYGRVTLVSDTLPPGLPAQVHAGRVRPANFSWLRRFAHVPNEYAFCLAVKRYLMHLHRSEDIYFTICHSHVLATIAAQRLKQKWGVPYALVTHGDIYERPPGTYDKRITAFYEWATPPAYRNADLVLALSPFMATWAQKGGADPQTIRVVPNGVDLEDLGLKQLKIEEHVGRDDDSPLSLLYVGSLTIPKGVDVLLDAVFLTRQRGVAVSLRIVGEGSLEAALRSQTRKLGVNSEVTFCGKLQRQELGNIYRSADLLCIPSVSDSLPTVVLEALAAGTPVLGTAVGGIPFMVSDGENGVLVPPSDPRAMADELVRLSKDRLTLRALRKNAAFSVSERFSWKTVGDLICSALEDTIRRRSSTENKI